MDDECDCGGEIIYVDHENVCSECYLVKEPSTETESLDQFEAFFNNRDRYSSGNVICQGGFWSKDDLRP